MPKSETKEQRQRRLSWEEWERNWRETDLEEERKQDSGKIDLKHSKVVTPQVWVMIADATLFEWEQDLADAEEKADWENVREVIDKIKKAQVL